MADRRRRRRPHPAAPAGPPPPPTLLGLAADRWRTVAPLLVGRGEVDLSTLETYCQVWARWRDAEARIATIGPLVKRGPADQPERQHAAPNPLIAISNQAAVQARALETLLGLVAAASGGRAPGAPLSMRQYAKRRGVSAEAVSKAVRDGRLRLSLTEVAGVPKIADPDLADREWRDNTDLTKAPGAVKGGGITLADAATRERVARAQLAELDYRHRAGELVAAREVERVWLALVVQLRTAVLGVAPKFKAQCPELTHLQLATLNELLRQTLDSLADDQPGAAASRGGLA